MDADSRGMNEFLRQYFAMVSTQQGKMEQKAIFKRYLMFLKEHDVIPELPGSKQHKEAKEKYDKCLNEYVNDLRRLYQKTVDEIFDAFRVPTTGRWDEITSVDGTKEDEKLLLVAGDYLRSHPIYEIAPKYHPEKHVPEVCTKFGFYWEEMRKAFPSPSDEEK